MGVRTKIVLALTVFLGIGSSPASSIDKQALIERYKHKYLVTLQDGLAVGICGAGTLSGPNMLNAKGLGAATLHINISEAGADYREQANHTCGSTEPEPIHKGEILYCDFAFFYMRKHFTLTVENVSPHAVRRGVGAFQHDTYEKGQADLRFDVDDPKDYDAIAALADKWVKIFDSQEEAAKFGNTASGIYVKEIKLGMTLAEVEAVMGPPQTKVELGEKVLSKYKDMTVEFHDGKVSDVK